MKIKNLKLKIGKYFPNEIESKWQKIWREQGIYKFKSSDSDKPHFAKASRGKYYNLVELPYPSGDLHLGHWFAFVPADAHARYMKMTGANVFFPNGFDAFGLPAENAAIKKGIHPRDWTLKNIETMRSQFETMGTMIDWSHTAITCLPDYYRWNQWIFLKMFEKGIAYRGKALSNWCPVDQTVLANEHIEQGRCWRCGAEVIQKEVEQWFLAITKYAEELIWPDPSTSVRHAQDKSSGPSVEWPKQVREGQNNWIGKSEGLLIDFDGIQVFTTKPETADGATFLVVAPEHQFVQKLLDKNFQFPISNFQLKDIKKYVEEAKKKTEMERKEDRTKSGIFIGKYVKNPVTGKDIPVWISDYVLAGYGTGAIMAVPFADERDREFAEKFNLPIEKTSFKAKPKGKKQINYHLRDWSISRQRYWGTPIPIIYCVNCWKIKNQKSKIKSEYGRDYIEIDGQEYAMVKVPESDLPVELPYNVDYTPKGKPPLATDEKWLNVKCPNCGGEAKRDAETLDTFFDSAWYYYRYASPDYKEGPFDKTKVKELLPVDIYFGGSEHTLGHTLYARFFTKFFKDLGLVSFDEFAKKRAQHGIVLAADGNKMSKSKGNVVNPEDVVKEFGADTVRLYLCFMMPHEATAPWSAGAIYGVFRFLKRVWELYHKFQISNFKYQMSNEDLSMMHKTIKKVGSDLKMIQFNTAVSSLMSWINYLSAKTAVGKEEYSVFLKLLAPFAPHITEELWQRLRVGISNFQFPPASPSEAGRAISNQANYSTMKQLNNFESIHLQSWPNYEEKYLIEDQVQVVVQINGKMRDTIQIQNSSIRQAQDKIQSEVETQAKKSQKVLKYLEGKEIKRVIYVEGKIINFVV
ncbi:MAG: hypothetical protein A2171_01555 [Candidatus Levybacteria bacterium RBG_13_35_9]|nr:MAG: hypothetical protein A2171_01555 [Candidatus Levybacteria bacterium RBG_13_35_9]